MRIDKFLKVSRIIKRRTVAKEVCDGGKVKINGRVAKAGTDVAAGDEDRDPVWRENFPRAHSKKCVRRCLQKRPTASTRCCAEAALAPQR